jgi:hypothetical protein
MHFAHSSVEKSSISIPMAEKTKVLFFGTACPLCGSSACVWTGGFEEEISEKIQQDFPRWTPDAGACGQCIKAYMPRRFI